MYSEWLKYMSHLGPYVARGVKDVEDNMNILKDNRSLICHKLKFIKKTDKQYDSLLSFIQFERSLGLARFNTENNSDLFPQVVEDTKNDFDEHVDTRITQDMYPHFKNYQSSAITTLMWAWFADFTGYLCHDYTTNTHLSMTEVA